MRKEDFEAIGITGELAEKAAAASADELKGFIPKHRFDEVNEAKKVAEEQIKERDGQLDTLKKSVKDNEDLTNQIRQLQDDNKAAAEKYAADIKAEQIKGIVERELIAAGAKNTKAVKALLSDLDKAELDGETVKGLADQIKKLQESEDSKFLFNIADGSSKFKGAKPPEGGEKKGNGEKNPWSKEHFNLTEQGRLLREDPELAKHYMSIK